MGVGQKSARIVRIDNQHETHHRDDRWWWVSVSQGARLLVRRRVEIVLGLLHGIGLMQRLLRLLLVLLLQATDTSLWTAKTSWCAVRRADLPCDLSVTLLTNVIRALFDVSFGVHLPSLTRSIVCENASLRWILVSANVRT